MSARAHRRRERALFALHTAVFGLHRTVLAHSIRLACANWHQADRVTPEWWASALEAR